MGQRARFYRPKGCVHHHSAHGTPSQPRYRLHNSIRCARCDCKVGWQSLSRWHPRHGPHAQAARAPKTWPTSLALKDFKGRVRGDRRFTSSTNCSRVPKPAKGKSQRRRATRSLTSSTNW
ncbi:TPA: hypothetical protein N0F65_002610 [Lagenidium giganteum]|uniref:C2H2-type domain-containing protein n=1 Tax=Lagenidium giganteum TaxID=4803 RepID=A0AAV2YVF6_9STRA|nr:TPA: hypothetical protein N0F65_002610 [Lagenidium giganteum]